MAPTYANSTSNLDRSAAGSVQHWHFSRVPCKLKAEKQKPTVRPRQWRMRTKIHRGLKNHIIKSSKAVKTIVT
jgi:hypothetical protein